MEQSEPGWFPEDANPVPAIIRQFQLLLIEGAPAMRLETIGRNEDKSVAEPQYHLFFLSPAGCRQLAGQLSQAADFAEELGERHEKPMN